MQILAQRLLEVRGFFSLHFAYIYCVLLTLKICTNTAALQKREQQAGSGQNILKQRAQYSKLTT